MMLHRNVSPLVRPERRLGAGETNLGDIADLRKRHPRNRRPKRRRLVVLCVAAVRQDPNPRLLRLASSIEATATGANPASSRLYRHIVSGGSTRRRARRGL